jgi:hypothetical protein
MILRSGLPFGLFSLKGLAFFTFQGNPEPGFLPAESKNSRSTGRQNLNVQVFLRNIEGFTCLTDGFSNILTLKFHFTLQ